MNEEKLYLTGLSKIPGVGAILARQLISYCGGVRQVFEANYRKLIRVPGIGDKVARLILKKETLPEAEKELESCERRGIEIHSYRDETYPRRLLPLYDAPLLLYTDGRINLNWHRSVGIVGTRRSTDYGRAVTDQLIRDLIPYNPLIISGLAYGIDITAHRAAVRNNLPTIGVMASGIDVIYPRSHKKTVGQMKESGGVISESGPGIQPDFQRFPARNRIIAGLSDVLIVVESAARGGSLITVEFAANYHRDIYAVPGQLDQQFSEGCNRLIKNNQATLFCSVAELAQDMRWTNPPVSQPDLFSTHSEKSVFDGFTLDESQILSLLKKEGKLQIDELHWKSGLAPVVVVNLLLHLEFKGVVKSLPGKRYQLS